MRDDASNNGTFFNDERITGSLRSQLPPALSASTAPRASSTRDAPPPRVDVLRTGGSIFLITSLLYRLEDRRLQAFFAARG